MLDQNTDRMWYVIGAVIVGAAIILLMNGTFPELFASVGETFKDKVEQSTEVTDGIMPVKKPDDTVTVTKETAAFGLSVQKGAPTPDSPVAISGVDQVKAGSTMIALDQPLHGLGESKDELYWDTSDSKWKIERRVGSYMFDGSEEIFKNAWGNGLTPEDNKNARLYYIRRSNIPNMKDRATVLFTHAPHVQIAKPFSIGVNNTASQYSVTYINVAIGAPNTINGMLAWLAQHKPVLYYELNTPKIEVLSDELQIALNEALKDK